jgi:hypothetical protein
MAFKDDIRIDKHRLDEECLDLPYLYWRWAKIEEEASAMVNVLMTDRAAIKAKVELELRGYDLDYINNQFDLDLKKLTESTYTSLVYIHYEVKEITERLNKARSEAATAKAARQALEKKKAMLDYLVDLHKQGYFITVEGKHTKRAKERARRKRIKH